MIFKGREVTQLVTDMTEYLRDLLLVKTSADAGEILDTTPENFRLLEERAALAQPEDLLRFIRIFGRMETIWKPDVISGRSLKQTAIRFSEAFQAASGNGESWDERRVRLSKPGGNPLAKQQELMRRQAMEIGRALFAPTLLRFAAKNLKDAAKDIPSAYSQETAWHYPGDKDTYTRLEYLAAAEHLHWMSQLEVNGYQDGPDDELLLTHTNMIPYKEITDPVLRHMCWIGVKTALTLE